MTTMLNGLEESVGKAYYPGLYTKFPQTIIKIYNEQFSFETINNMVVNMGYFKRYTAYGFYGLRMAGISMPSRQQ